MHIEYFLTFILLKNGNLAAGLDYEIDTKLFTPFMLSLHHLKEMLCHIIFKYIYEWGVGVFNVVT